MKKVGGVVATTLIAAACATVAISQQNLSSCQCQGLMRSEGSEQTRNSEDKFAPRFDGLRFIETLVTAHR